MNLDDPWGLDNRKVADMEWERYLKQRNLPYKPFEEMESNVIDLWDEQEFQIRVLYAEQKEKEKEKERVVSNQIEDKKNKKKKERKERLLKEVQHKKKKKKKNNRIYQPKVEKKWIEKRNKKNISLED